LASLIDLRSDTVTRPSEQMRAAMAAAEVGDDVYGEDPTVNLLEKRAAEAFGREAALFVPTGTMGNQIAIRLLTQPGQEVIAESRSHILDWEMATTAVFSGCLVRAVPAERGILTWKHIEPVIYARGAFRAATGSLKLRTRPTWLAAVARRCRCSKRFGTARRNASCRCTWMERASSMRRRRWARM